VKHGLVGQIVAAGVVVVLFFAAEFAFFTSTISHLRTAAAGQRRAEEAALTASTLERLVVDLETGQRGYVITGNASFLEPSRQAKRELPGVEARLDLLTTGSDDALADDLVRRANEYRDRWVTRVVGVARQSLPRARALVATGGGKRRVDEIRSDAQRLAAQQAALGDRRRADVDALVRRGVVVGVVGLVGTFLLFVAIVGYFLRSAVLPLRRLAAATARVARGQLATRVPPGGAGEVGELAGSFNAMAASLERSHRELQRQVGVTRAVLDSTVDGICLTDPDGNVLLANRPLVEFVLELDLPQEGSVPERLLAVADRFPDPDRYRAAMERIAANPDAPSFDEFEFAGTQRTFQGFTAPVRDEDGTPLGRVWTLREVTAERAAARAKDEFVATISHELRTPLTSIVGFLEMLLDGTAGGLGEEQRRYLEIVQRSSQRLMRQVSDLLFIARLDQAGLTLSLEDVELDELVGDCVESHRALARQRSIDLDFDPGDPPPLRADPERLSQVTANLLSNALKFTPEGGRVDVRTFRSNGSVVLEVEDTGVGIPEGERHRLFERFFRASTATRQAVQGTGLGLAISKAIVEAHGGTIEAEPVEERGTRFRVVLPA
jgi:signal transduction histidine kinase